MNQITKKSASNIALVKYWGKKERQIPMNPSISMTLQESYTATTVNWSLNETDSENQIHLLFEGKENILFEKRIKGFIDNITPYIPVLNKLNLNINSSNSFPHSSGIASSASAMSALSLCLIHIEMSITGNIYGFEEELQKASFIARLGSGSAARSVYPGFTLWGKTQSIPNSSDEFAIPINEQVHEVFHSYKDAILIVSDKIKKISSSVGHALMENHPFAANKFQESIINTERLLKIIKTGEQMDFVTLVESEALLLHAMMLSSNPQFILMEPNTLALIQKIQNFRMGTNIPVCFTLDAGANVHLLYPNNESKRIKDWINTELVQFCVNGKWIDDKVNLGKG